MIKGYLLGTLVVTVGMGVASAGTATFTTGIKKVSVSNSNINGGCIAQTGVSPSTKLPSCKWGWIAFSCAGKFNAKDVAYRKLDQAQMAVALNKNVAITITDDQKHNGYCFAKRIDIIK